jgi:hypothetical protein
VNAVVATAERPAIEVVSAPPSSLVPQSMDEAVRLAQMMSKGRLVPEHLQEAPADCLMVIEQAARWRMSPFAVAQTTSVIKGKLMYEGKLVAAAIHTSGILVGRLNYTFSGSGDKRAVTVSGLLKGDTEPKTVEVTLANVITDNGCWKKQPDQQLCYSGARVWARRWAPEVMLGVYVPEEFPDTDDPMQDGSGHASSTSRTSFSETGELMPRAKGQSTGLPSANVGGVSTEPANSTGSDPDNGTDRTRSGIRSKLTGNPVNENMLKILRRKANANKVSEDDLAKKFGVSKLEELTMGVINEAMRVAGGAS